ncbi:MFS transporter [Amycolatopsis pithecellobii]|uniref:Lysosomal dipeptide transporter MFSD1 n=1 Tax=Amycolatopsis pithecellobii TaxID=664692 RepID=A0A6N7Z089_9PSEU|nr:MFS transporter [Amycolatopsis pithecellobii]MTD54099.1 MFS transporter [Amycolatopsis pithecellobii]
MVASTQAPVTGKASRRSWLVWFVAALVYLLAVFHRTSFGVAGLEAADRFGVGAAALSAFTVLQVGVYAVMQIPTGVLVDRYGPRRILIAALLCLALGQVLTAFATSYGLALLGRGVLGFGDAITFVSVLRLSAAHFPGRQYTVVMSLTSAIGFVGNLAATVPLTLLLDGPGWLPTFLVAGLVTALYSAVVAARVRDTPAGHPATPVPVDRRELLRQIRSAWRVPGTRLGFWVHFSTGFAPTVLTLLWGVPFLVRGEGIAPATASALLTVFVFGAMFVGPVVGGLVAARPGLRMPLVAAYLGGATAVWSLLLSLPGPLPVAILLPCFAFLALGVPASTIAFALARDYNPLHRVGTATGLVNVGGFSATTVAALLVGVLLQYTGSFRIALLAVVAVLVYGTFRLLVWWRRARAELFAAQARGEQVPVQVRRHAWDTPAGRPASAAA